jgi:hypothetical protein
MITEHTEIKYIRVYDKGVFGCIRHKKDIMISICDPTSIVDVFLTQTQAKQLLKDLEEEVNENKSGETS